VSDSGDNGSEMPRPDSFDNASPEDHAIDALLAGTPAAENAALASFVEEVRAAAGAVPTPSPALAAAIAAGGISTQPPPVAQWRKFPMKLKGFLAGLGIAGKLALGVGVAAAATTGAGAAGVLPGAVQHAVAKAVSEVSPFSMPDGDHHGSHDGNLATGDTTTTIADGVTTTTVTGSHESEPAHDDKGKGIVVTPTTVAHHDDTNPTDGVTPTTVAEHHDDNNGTTDGHDNTTPTTVADHHDDNNTTPTTEHHDGDHNNPEAITLSCSVSSDATNVTCMWSGPTTADHARFVVLRDDGRAFFPNEGALSYTDTKPVSQTSYIVDSLRADDSVAAHSNRVKVEFNAPTTTTTVGGDHH
jgi:hypothetical protein